MERVESTGAGMKRARRWAAGLAFGVALAMAGRAAAQAGGARVTVRVRSNASPVRGAEVRADGGAVRASTDLRGQAPLVLAAGAHVIDVRHLGFAPETLRIVLREGADTTVSVALREAALEEEAVVVTVTRSGTLVGEQPIRVEAVPQEEVEENLTVAPGNLTTLLQELAGVQMASAAPGLGGVSLRVRGLPGRHTQVLTDGLPLLGADPAGFGLLQTPPLDLARVEVIKGVASALYGGSGLGGVLNLVSQRPGAEPALVVDRTSLHGTDAVAFASAGSGRGVGATITGAWSDQPRRDPDGDGWAEVAGYRRAGVRPRLFWDGGAGRSLLVTAGALTERRAGGTLPGRVLPGEGAFAESLRTRRGDAGAVLRWLTPGGLLWGARASAVAERRDRTFGGATERDRLGTAFGEGTVGSTTRGHTWVVGAAVQRDALRAPDAPGVGYARTVPGLFAQDEYAAAEWLTLSASGRVDHAPGFGTFTSPRVSVLVRPAVGWTLRGSAGTGFALPTPLVDETEEVGLRALLPVRGVRPERAASASLDASWTAAGWELGASTFATRIRHPLDARGAGVPGRLELVNGRSLGVRGAETVARFVAGDLHCIASYTYLDATETTLSGAHRQAALVPRHSGELAALLEDERRGRVGVELGLTGPQRLEFDPYRSRGRAFAEVNVLAEVRFGDTGIFFNALNLGGVRQTRWDPFIAPVPGPGGRRTVDAWAPLAGRTFNLGIRAEL